MNNRKHHAALFLLAAGSLLLPACSLTDILTNKIETAYDLVLPDTDPDTATYLKKILNERLTDKTKNLSDDPTERARQENYIEQTIRADLLTALHARGYYKAGIEYNDDPAPLSGQYNITYGPQFFIESLTVNPPLYEQHLEGSSLTPLAPLAAAPVLAAQQTLYDSVQKDRCYFNLAVNNEVILNNTQNSAQVSFNVTAGAEGHFGPLSFTGNVKTKDSYLRKLVPWKEGDCFRREKIEDYKTRLLQSGLFTRAEENLPDAPAPDGTVPLRMELRERAHRSLSAGATYYTDEGIGTQFGWEHRNLFGAAEKLSAALTLSLLKQGLDFNFQKSYFLRDDQTLSLTTSILNQQSDAYDETGIKAGIALKRSFTKNLSGSAGIDLNLTNLRDHTDRSRNSYGLASLPLSLTYDTRDKPLDPHKGLNITATIEPFFDAFGESDQFFRTLLTGTTYFALGTDADLVLATRGGIGSIWGADTAAIPANKRFYAGGGGSVRGYGYQEVGPRKNGDPSGGSSLINLSLELRGKFNDKFGAAAFIDSASISEDSTPRFTNVAVGAGIGLRYYTDIGPIRFDVATPLTQKDDLEQNYQIYISIGQAF